MTFLEYVCERLLGKPRRVGGSPGESYWTCPYCGRYAEAFHTFPSKPGLKDRWKCWKCDMRGDEADLMAHFYAGEDWPRRRVRLEEWREDFDREGKADVALVDRGGGGIRGSHSSPGDSGKGEGRARVRPRLGGRAGIQGDDRQGEVAAGLGGRRHLAARDELLAARGAVPPPGGGGAEPAGVGRL
jgi:hypothetical protein